MYVDICKRLHVQGSHEITNKETVH